MPSRFTLGFFGAGRMATALARGFVKAGLVRSNQILASDPFEPARKTFAKEVGARITASNLAVIDFADVLVLAVKPGQVTEVLDEVRDRFEKRHLLISICAGVPLARLESRLPARARVVRVMPNTPALVGASATAWALGAGARKSDSRRVQTLFASVGIAFEVKEALLDAVTGLSGSGPAYACLMIEALSDGGVAAGLPREVATRLAAQTLAGTARMVLETGGHPGVLRDMVTSPGGTTIEGLHELERAGVRSALINAVRAATDKSRKLGQG